jgi:polygalacturonase
MIVRLAGSCWRRVCVAALFGAIIVGCSGKSETDDTGAGGAGAAAGSAGAALGGGGSAPTGAAGAASVGTAGAIAAIGGAGGSSAGASGAGTAGAAGSTGGAAGSAGSAGAAGGSTYPTTCDNLGLEPVIPPACATLLAPKTVASGSTLTDEATLDTKTIQAAIDACPNGQAVKLATDGDKNAFLSAGLFLRSGVTLWIDKGVTLFASRNPRDFDAAPNLCGLGTGSASNCNALINAINLSGAGVMGEGTVDGRGGENVIGQDPPLTWWQMNDKSHFDGNLVAPRLIQTSGGKNFTLYEVTFHSSPKFHIVIGTTVGFVVWGINVITDPTSPNTDGVDPAGATNGVIAYNKISTGDDNIAIKGSGPLVNNLIIAHNHFGKGHGMSIGSETYGGVQNVKVCDLSLDGTSNGIRIKSDVSRGGLVSDISYTDVCMRSVKDPLVFDPYYSVATGAQIPNFQGITLTNVHILSGGANTFRGYDATKPLIIGLDNVVMDDTGAETFKAQDAKLTFGPGPVNFTPSGTDVTVTKNITATTAPRDCSAAWVTF